MNRSAVPRRAWRLSRNRKRLVMACLPAFLVFGGALGVAAGDLALGLSNVVTGVVLTVILLARTWTQNAEPRFDRVRLGLADGRLTVGQVSLPVEDITAGHRLAGPTPRVRLLRRRRPSLDLELESVDEAHALLEALGVDAGQRVATFHGLAPTPHTAKGWLARLAPAALILVAYALWGASYLWFPLVTLSLVTSLFRRKAHVGSDGVRVERGLWFDRFIAHDRLTEVEVIPSRREDDGANVALRTTEGETRVGFRTIVEAEAFAARVGDAQRRRSDGDDPLTTALARGNDDVTSWVARLRAALHRGALRTGAVTDGQLWRIVEGTGAAPVDRAAAAVALGDTLSAPDKQRILAVASATASPRLRVVLETVSDDDEEALVEALAALVTEEQRQPA